MSNSGRFGNYGDESISDKYVQQVISVFVTIELP